MKTCGGCERFKDGRCYLNPPVMMQQAPIQYVSGDAGYHPGSPHHVAYPQYGHAYTQGTFAPMPVRPMVGKDEKACSHWMQQSEEKASRHGGYEVDGHGHGITGVSVQHGHAITDPGCSHPVGPAIMNGMQYDCARGAYIMVSNVGVLHEAKIDR